MKKLRELKGAPTEICLSYSREGLVLDCTFHLQSWDNQQSVKPDKRCSCDVLRDQCALSLDCPFAIQLIAWKRTSAYDKSKEIDKPRIWIPCWKENQPRNVSPINLLLEWFRASDTLVSPISRTRFGLQTSS